MLSLFFSRLGGGRAVVSRWGGATRGILGGGRPITKFLPGECLDGREEPISAAPGLDEKHYTLGTRLHPPFPEDTEMIMLGMGCYWCSEDIFMKMKGIYSTHVGFAQGVTTNPTYKEVCTGRTNHNEVVRVVYHPSKLALRKILEVFFEQHDPTSSNRQGGDVGTQYRSGILSLHAYDFP
ncbi:hypothetical protein AAMO2058_001280500 [Amorphochlora amoebiformis]